MTVDVGIKIFLQFWEHVFVTDEVKFNAMLVPDRPLSAHWSIRTAAGKKSFLPDSSNHVHSHDAWWVSHLEGTVYIEAYEYSQSSSLIAYLSFSLV